MTVEIDGKLFPKYWKYKVPGGYNVWEVLGKDGSGRVKILLLGRVGWLKTAYERYRLNYTSLSPTIFSGSTKYEQLKLDDEED